MIRRARSVGIYVGDQERALRFFTDVCGMEVRLDQRMGEDPASPRWVEVAPPGAETVLVLFTPDGQEDRVGTFANVIFACDDIHETYAALSRAGVVFPTPPERASWGGWWATFEDPDGNEYGLTETGR